MNPCVVVALLAILLIGCKRHDVPAASAQSSAAVPAATADAMPAPGPPTQAPGESVVIPENPDINATLDELSTQYRVYVSRTRSKPADFQDFVTRAHVQAPPPPAGQSYAIVGGKVVLVKK